MTFNINDETRTSIGKTSGINVNAVLSILSNLRASNIEKNSTNRKILEFAQTALPQFKIEMESNSDIDQRTCRIIMLKYYHYVKDF